MTFHGRNRGATKRKAVAWWANNGERLGLSLRDFLACCRMDPSECTIVFTPPGLRRAS